MALTTQQRIQLQELLLQREALYSRIARTEAKIHEIFGEEYPLPPPDVEVATPGKKNKTAKAKKKAAKATPKRIRALEGSEVAYRIRFHDSDSADEIHEDRKAISAYLEAPIAANFIERIETIDADESSVDQVYP